MCWRERREVLRQRLSGAAGAAAGTVPVMSWKQQRRGGCLLYRLFPASCGASCTPRPLAPPPVTLSRAMMALAAGTTVTMSPSSARGPRGAQPRGVGSTAWSLPHIISGSQGRRPQRSTFFPAPAAPSRGACEYRWRKGLRQLGGRRRQRPFCRRPGPTATRKTSSACRSAIAATGDRGQTGLVAGK